MQPNPVNPQLAPNNLSANSYATPKSSFKKSLFVSIGLILLLILSIAGGVYLTQDSQDLTPQADQVVEIANKTSLILTSKGQKESTLDVKVMVRADVDPINLIVANLKYPKENLEVLSIATSSATLDLDEKEINGKWLDASSTPGEINLSLGIPNPGFKSDAASNEKYLLALIKFKVLKSGEGRITIDPEKSKIFRNLDNLDILSDRHDFLTTLSMVSVVPGGVASASATPTIKPKVTTLANLKILSPQGGEVFSYFNPIDIKWEQENIQKVTISLLLNDVVYGNIATNLEKVNNYSWKAQNTLPLTYINPNSVFQIKITGTTSNNQTISTITPGYFGLVSQTDLVTKLTPKLEIEKVNADINNDQKQDYFDISLLLSNFNKQKFEESYDFNQDGVINTIDLWLLRNIVVNPSSE